MTDLPAMRATWEAAPQPWTADDPRAPALPEALRQMLAATGLTTRRMLLTAVSRHLNMDDAAMLPLRRTLDALERAGDVLAGPGGRVAPAPVQRVTLPTGDALLVGGVPTATLLEVASGCLVTEGYPRRVTASSAVWDTLLATLEGCTVSVGRWSGLDDAPAADDTWLASLTERWESSRLLGGLFHLGSLPSSARQGYRPATAVRPQPYGWTAAPTLSAHTLVRWRDGRADWHFGWTGADDGRCLPLGRDEATRTRFALDRAAGGNLPVRVRPTGDGTSVQIDGQLPAAEYRYLLATSQEVVREGYSTAYTVPAGAWDEVAQILRTSLGLPV